MIQFHCDIDREADSRLVQAIQTICDVISSFKSELKKSRCDQEQLEAELKSLQDSMNATSEVPKTPLSHDRRKRKKLSNRDGDLDAFGANASIDLNNAAFFLSSTCGDDEDVIDPTQLSKTPSPLRVNVDRSNVARKPFVDSNKENQEKVPVLPSLAHTQARSTVTCGTGWTSVRKNLFEKAISIDDDDDQLNESKASERLLPNWMTKKKSTAVATVDANKPMAKKKNRLSLGKTHSNAPKLRQATISFQAKSESKNDDETYCEEFATFQQSEKDTSMQRDSPASSPTVSSGDSIRNAMAQIKIEKSPPMSSKERAKRASHGSDAMTSEPMLKIEPNTDNVSSDAVIILNDPISEVITLDDTQSSAGDYEQIFDAQTQSEDLLLSEQPRKLGPFQPEVAAIAAKPVPTKKSDNVACPDCEKYNQVIRGAIGDKVNTKGLRFMDGKCAKHRNNDLCQSTPPNYWDPRMPATPEGEHIETPFDYRFVTD